MSHTSELYDAKWEKKVDEAMLEGDMAELFMQELDFVPWGALAWTELDEEFETIFLHQHSPLVKEYMAAVGAENLSEFWGSYWEASPEGYAEWAEILTSMDEHTVVHKQYVEFVGNIVSAEMADVGDGEPDGFNYCEDRYDR